jgi:ADP-ribose pyrophosphatase
MTDVEHKVVDSRIIHSGKVVTLRIDDIALDNGHITPREIVVHVPCIVIVPYFEKEGNFLMIEQFRDPIRKSLWEFPAGMVKGNETPEMTANRELEEETGYVAKKLDIIGQYFTSPGFTDELHHLCLARDLVQKFTQVPDEKEVTRMFKVSRKTLFEKIKKGEIEDGKTILAYYWTQSFLSKYAH